jgi:hypothetical protein
MNYNEKSELERRLRSIQEAVAAIAPAWEETGIEIFDGIEQLIKDVRDGFLCYEGNNAMTVKGIVKNYLENNGYDGLTDDEDCECFLDFDFMNEAACRCEECRAIKRAPAEKEGTG